jgi:hypothetical protein
VFEEKNSIDPAAVIRMLQKAPREYRLDGPLKLRISRPMEKEDVRFDFATELLKRLEVATPAKAPGTTGATGATPQPGGAAAAKAAISPPPKPSGTPAPKGASGPQAAPSSSAAKAAKAGTSGGGKRG